MLTTFQIETDEHRQQVQALFWEYLTWANDSNNREFGIQLDIHAMLDDDMAHLEKFMPPQGRLLLAQDERGIAGCVCLKKLTDGVGEIKRLYVRPSYRRQGVGRTLVSSLIEYAREIGYHTLRLDSARYMSDAHTLYRAAGFHDIGPYLESEIPQEFHPLWVFMEMSLT